MFTLEELEVIAAALNVAQEHVNPGTPTAFKVAKAIEKVEAERSALAATEYANA